MEIGFPSSVRHIAHVTFDRFQGFLGLPVELELEVPRRVPSASTSAFGVSVESMQCSFDAYGNSVPTILLLLQERLYEQGGLKIEGIFRINPDNDKEEQLRDKVNKGIVPYDVDAHCLAGLIKAWFRELPKGVLDSLSPEEVMQCHTDDQCISLIKKLPPSEAALFDWAINLMADVVQEESYNKMNVRNIAVVFAPNMTQMMDPLMALKHAVQVMNLLTSVICKTLNDRERSVIPSSAVLWDGSLTGSEGEESRPAKMLEVVHSNLTLRAQMGTGHVYIEAEGRCNDLNTLNSRTSARAREGYNDLNSIKSGTRAKELSVESEIVEEGGSIDGSEYSSSVHSSERGNGGDDHKRFSDAWETSSDSDMTDNALEQKIVKSQPLAILLRKRWKPITRNKFEEFSQRKWSLSEESYPLKKGNSAICSEKQCNEKIAHMNIQDRQKSLEYALHHKPWPAIALSFMENGGPLKKGEKMKGMKPSCEGLSPISELSAYRAAHPLSKRTLYLKHNGTA
ncbi:hypothetical protein KP509_32G018700 [Ceratopteris richardii]|uniref:Rho-GAP domain-containing protein n=1 Tax=Ceratopteris richardii TaxID=49495 RepID=A0A8T2QSW9_CERRI|nr:hypothetical protein KP509_32G018700 [Ceratopteris richardii]KAH7286699.1 hypothetical protein KP509_32G018700 [Ceratopteris richardii]